MLHLKTFYIGPPGGWRYIQEESGLVITSITFFDLVKKVALHRQNNGYSTHNVAEEVEDQICSRMEPRDQDRYCDLGTRSMKSIHWSEVQRFLTDLVGWLKTGFEPVSQTEADRRAAICRTCPLNIGMHGCGSCRQTLDEVRASIMKLQTVEDRNLLACGVCGCELKTAVHVPLDVLRSGQKNLVFPNWCWQANESPPADDGAA